MVWNYNKTNILLVSTIFGNLLQSEALYICIPYILGYREFLILFTQLKILYTILIKYILQVTNLSELYKIQLLYYHFD